jgi:hypothetical protein
MSLLTHDHVLLSRFENGNDVRIRSLRNERALEPSVSVLSDERAATKLALRIGISLNQRKLKRDAGCLYDVSLFTPALNLLTIDSSPEKSVRRCAPGSRVRFSLSYQSTI